jgi:hypothetical protein
VTDAGWVLVGGGVAGFAALLGLAASGERAVLDEVQADRSRYSPQTRLMLDMARAGTCGQPVEDRRRWATAALEVAEWSPYRAVAEPLGELSQVLRTALDEEWSRQFWAHGLGAAWRAEYSFRRARLGDPYDVLRPQADDAASALALDRARRLPRVPAALVERGGEVAMYGALDVGTSVVPYSRSLALALIGAAEAELWSSYDALAEAIRDSGAHHLRRTLDFAHEVLHAARLWVEYPTLRYVAIESVLTIGLPQKKRSGVRWRASDERLRRVTGLARRAVEYVRGYAGLVPALRQAEDAVVLARARLAAYRGDPKATPFQLADAEQDLVHAEAEERRLQAMFPDFYPEAA